jgi:hypothetical protein
MGIRGLWTTFRRHFTPVEPLDVPKERIGIDMFSLVYTYRANIDELLEVLQTWTAHGHTLHCVWDGTAPKEKQEIIGQRRNARESAIEKKNDLEKYLTDYGNELSEADIKHLKTAITSLSWQGWHMTGSMKRYIQETLGPSVIHIFAAGEADDILIEMMTNKTISIVLSLDSDLFAMGAEHIWRLLRIRGKWLIENIYVENVCTAVGVSLAQLQEACYLAGWDRCHLNGGTYMTFESALNRIKHYQTCDAVLERFPLDTEDTGAMERLSTLKKESKHRWQQILRERVNPV